MDWTLAIQGAIGIGVVVFLLHLSKKSQEGVENIAKTLSKQAEKLNEAAKATPAHEYEERLASIERRMSMLEEDAKTILARASTRLQRAKRMARELGDLEDEEETDETPVGQQFRLPFTPTNGQADNEEDALEAVKAAMRR